MEEERTREYFLSGGHLLHGCVVGAASPRCWPLCWFNAGATTLGDLPYLTV
jgi:hypothetical protein